MFLHAEDISLEEQLREAEREAGRRSGGRDKVSAPRPTLAAPLTLPCSTSPPKVMAQKGALLNQRQRPPPPVTNGTAAAHAHVVLTRQKEASFCRKDVKMEKKKKSPGLTSSWAGSKLVPALCASRNVMCPPTSPTPLPAPLPHWSLPRRPSPTRATTADLTTDKC